VIIRVASGVICPYQGADQADQRQPGHDPLDQQHGGGLFLIIRPRGAVTGYRRNDKQTFDGGFTPGTHRVGRYQLRLLCKRYNCRLRARLWQPAIRVTTIEPFESTQNGPFFADPNWRSKRAAGRWLSDRRDQWRPPLSQSHPRDP